MLLHFLLYWEKNTMYYHDLSCQYRGDFYLLQNVLCCPVHGCSNLVGFFQRWGCLHADSTACTTMSFPRDFLLQTLGKVFWEKSFLCSSSKSEPVTFFYPCEPASFLQQQPANKHHYLHKLLLTFYFLYSKQLTLILMHIYVSPAHLILY